MTDMVKRTSALVGALVLAGGLMVATVEGAVAAPDGKPPPTCGKGGFCVWSIDGDGSYERHRTEGNTAWPSTFRQDDIAWANNGHYQPGADHVRVYDSRTSPDEVTLCVHRGHYGSSGTNDATADAAYNGSYHRWGGECSSSEPEL